MGTVCSNFNSKMPFPGSPGDATIGANWLHSTRKLCAKCAPASLCIQGSTTKSTPRRSFRKATVSASGATIPVSPPSSAHILVSVARSSVRNCATALPVNSNTLPTPPPSRIKGKASRCSTMSLAVMPMGSDPTNSTRRQSGTVRRTAPVTKALAMSVVPTPKATQPNAPLCGVCESVPTTTWPGSA